MILCVDAGNQRIKWALFDPLRPDIPLYSSAVEEAELRASWSVLDTVPRSVHVASVRASTSRETMTRLCEELWGIAPNWLQSHTMGWGVRSGYTDPDALGVDRFAALVAASRRHPAGALVVDAGTAITVDLLLHGVHQGGLIMPGLRAQSDALGTAAAGIVAPSRMPAPSQADSPLGRDTNTGIALGGLYAVAGACTIVLRRCHGASDVPLILTGGDAGVLSEWLPGQVEQHRDLVLEGIACMATHNSTDGTCGSSY